jgi:hypothetical protein
MITDLCARGVRKGCEEKIGCISTPTNPAPYFRRRGVLGMVATYAIGLPCPWSSDGAVVVVQHAGQPLAPLNLASLFEVPRLWTDELTRPARQVNGGVGKGTWQDYFGEAPM